MYKIRSLKTFDDWLNGIKDPYTRIRLARRLEKASRGNLGDVAPVGENVLKCGSFGPGLANVLYSTGQGLDLDAGWWR